MPKDDLLEHAKSSEDFYALLEVPFEASEADIRRAYRKTALKYHPDKLGDAFDPEKFHLLQIASDVLSDPAAKAVYDQGRQAKRQKELRDAALDGKRKAMVDDLERREWAARTGVKIKTEKELELEDLIRKGIEHGRRLRMEHEEAHRVASLGSEPVNVSQTASKSAAAEPESRTTLADDPIDDEEVARQRIKLRKADKKARKNGYSAEAEGHAGKYSGFPEPLRKDANGKTPSLDWAATRQRLLAAQKAKSGKEYIPVAENYSYAKVDGKRPPIPKFYSFLPSSEQPKPANGSSDHRRRNERTAASTDRL